MCDLFKSDKKDMIHKSSSNSVTDSYSDFMNGCDLNVPYFTSFSVFAAKVHKVSLLHL